jgi:SAM-dependent MidA family methyltransferase
MLTNKEATTQVKNILPFIAMHAENKGLEFDYGYLIKENAWICEFYNAEGKTIEYYKEPTTNELLTKILNK